jgi:hypothetical protein
MNPFLKIEVWLVRNKPNKRPYKVGLWRCSGHCSDIMAYGYGRGGHNRSPDALTLSFYYKKEEGVAGQERCSGCCSGVLYFVPKQLFRNKRPEQGQNGDRNRENTFKNNYLKFFVPD